MAAPVNEHDHSSRTLLLRDLDADLVAVFERRASRAGRSLQQELHLALRREAKRNFDEAMAAARSFHERFADRDFADSAALVREDREERERQHP